MCNVFKLKASMTSKQISHLKYSNQEKQRKCLRCDKMFLSEFRGNRICTVCKRSDQMEMDTSFEWTAWPNNQAITSNE